LFAANAFRVSAHEAQHRAEEMAIDLEERARVEAIREPVHSQREIAVVRDHRTVELPLFPFDRRLRGLDPDDLAFLRERHDAIRPHRIKADGIAITVQPRPQPVIQWRGMHRDLRQRANVKLPNAPQRLRENPPLRLELMIQPQRRPITAPTFPRDRTRHRAPQRGRLHELHELRLREAFLHLVQPHARDITGVGAGGEDREAVDARERVAAGDELRGFYREDVARLHGRESMPGFESQSRKVSKSQRGSESIIRVRPASTFAIVLCKPLTSFASCARFKISSCVSSSYNEPLA
jgi:hypothetical protein